MSSVRNNLGMYSGNFHHWLHTATLLTALVTAGGLAGSVMAQDSNEVKIGALLPLSGGNAVIGNMGKLGVNMAVKEINDAGGVLGRKINGPVAKKGR